jgi:oligopeptide transport system substrate-binding protein
VNEEWKVILRLRLDPLEWQARRFRWVGDHDDAFTFLEIFKSSHGQNFTGHSDLGYDKPIAMIAREPYLDRHHALMERAERRVRDAYPIIPIFFNGDKHLVKPSVYGSRANIMDHNCSRHLRVVRNSN